jgi:methionyl-tRNA formyltransferase
MKIILMGQQAFGKSTLEKFYKETDHEIVAVYCAPDKEGKPLKIKKS